MCANVTSPLAFARRRYGRKMYRKLFRERQRANVASTQVRRVEVCPSWTCKHHVACEVSVFVNDTAPWLAYLGLLDDTESLAPLLPLLPMSLMNDCSTGASAKSSHQLQPK